MPACVLAARSGCHAPEHSSGAKQFITSELLISQRPPEVADCAVPGHWEGDLNIGLNSSAIGTLVERRTRFPTLLDLPPMAGHIPAAHNKNDPALTVHGAEAVRDAIAAKIATLPEQLGKSLTWDQGAEMAQHAQLRIETGLAIYFCDLRAPGSAAPTRTRTDCCDSTSRRAPI